MGSAGEFTALASEQGIYEKNSDIGALERSVFAKLKTARELTWERKLIVRVAGRAGDPSNLDDAYRSEMSAKLELTVISVDMATDKFGSVVTRYGPDSQPHRYEHNGAVVIADTPEAREALGKVVEATGKLVSTLNHFLGEDEIQAALAKVNAGGMRALTAPADNK